MLTWLRRILFGWRASVRLGQRRIALPIVFTALLVCCGGTFVWALVDSGLRQAGVLPTYTPTATRLPTLTATAAPAPSATAEPTATRRPSRTPKPTATARPKVTDTAAATSRLSAAEQAYVAAMVEITDAYSKALRGIGEESMAAGEDVTLLLDDDWKLRMALYMALLKVEGEAVRGLTAPVRFGPMHAEMLIAAEHFDRSADLMAGGIDAFDVEAIGLATREMNEGTAAIQRAQGLLGEMVE